VSEEATSVHEPVLERARRAVAEAERAEAAERAKLMALIDRERHVRYALEQASAAIRIARDAAGLRESRSRLEALEGERQALFPARRTQEGVVDRYHEQTRAARVALEELEQRAARLREAVRHAEQQLATRQRAVAELEAELARILAEVPRLQGQRAESEGRLAVLLRELAELEGG
jgi:chromosome segregation ATPase